MTNQFSPLNSKMAELEGLENEIAQLEQKLKTEQQPDKLNDLRLRLRFIKWKKELLTIAYGGKR
jgi:DnaJ-domain-containing protein 1